MIKDAGSECDDYSISPKIGHILLHWGYELTEKDFLLICQTNTQKMSYYQFNRQEILQKAKERYSKEKATEYYAKKRSNKKKSQKIDTKTCNKKKKTKSKSIKRKDINN